MTKEEYEAKKLRKEKTTTMLITTMVVLGIIIGLIFNMPKGHWFMGIIIGGFVGFLLSGMIMAIFQANEKPQIPFFVYEFFEEKKEEILTYHNIGEHKLTGRYQYYEASQFFEVQTDKDLYIIKVEQDEISSISKQEKTLQ